MSDEASSTNSNRQRRRWSELSPRARAWIVFGGVAELIMTTLALRDLRRRPRDRVRGSKRFWVPMCFVQPIGVPLYFLFGRRRDDS